MTLIRWLSTVLVVVIVPSAAQDSLATHPDSYIDVKSDSLQNTEKDIVSVSRTGSGEKGFLLDQTYTDKGHLFYSSFFIQWNPDAFIQEYTITINETHSIPNNRAIISILLDNTVIRAFYLANRSNDIEEQVLTEVTKLSEYLRERKLTEFITHRNN